MSVKKANSIFLDPKLAKAVKLGVYGRKVNLSTAVEASPAIFHAELYAIDPREDRRDGL